MSQRAKADTLPRNRSPAFEIPNPNGDNTISKSGFSDLSGNPISSINNETGHERKRSFYNRSPHHISPGPRMQASDERPNWEDVNEMDEGSEIKQLKDLACSDREIRREIKKKPLQIIHGLEERVLLPPDRKTRERSQPADLTNLTDTDQSQAEVSQIQKSIKQSGFVNLQDPIVKDGVHTMMKPRAKPVAYDTTIESIHTSDNPSKQRDILSSTEKKQRKTLPRNVRSPGRIVNQDLHKRQKSIASNEAKTPPRAADVDILNSLYPKMEYKTKTITDIKTSKPSIVTLMNENKPVELVVNNMEILPGSSRGSTSTKKLDSPRGHSPRRHSSSQKPEIPVGSSVVEPNLTEDEFDQPSEQEYSGQFEIRKEEVMNPFDVVPKQEVQLDYLSPDEESEEEQLKAVEKAIEKEISQEELIKRLKISYDELSNEEEEEEEEDEEPKPRLYSIIEEEDEDATEYNRSKSRDRSKERDSFPLQRGSINAKKALFAPGSEKKSRQTMESAISINKVAPAPQLEEPSEIMPSEDLTEDAINRK